MYLPFLKIRGLMSLLVVAIGALSLAGCEEVNAAQTVHPIQMVHPIRLK